MLKGHTAQDVFALCICPSPCHWLIGIFINRPERLAKAESDGMSMNGPFKRTFNIKHCHSDKSWDKHPGVLAISGSCFS